MPTINLQLSIEEVNQILSALNVGLIDKIKSQAMTQLQVPAPVETPAAE